MSGVTQATFMNQRSFGPPAIGDAYAGGFYAGQISTTANGVATHNLVVGPLASAERGSVQWSFLSSTPTGVTSVIDGPGNSAALNNSSYPAIQFCENLTVGGFSDWYMPARNELEVCYFNLKNLTLANDTNIGANLNAVPSRPSNYTTGTPAQTSAAAFQSGGSQAFAMAYYWSSTEATAYMAWTVYFRAGGQPSINKGSYTSTNRVRAVRRVPV